MKTIYTFLLACILSPIALVAQQDMDDIDFFKALFGVDKLTIVEDFISVPEAKSDAFWTTYKAYETARKALRSERITILRDYADNYENLSEEQIEDLCKRSLKQNKKNTKNIEKYFKKLKKAGGITAAAQFLQIEKYFLSLSTTAIYENLPFLGELERIDD